MDTLVKMLTVLLVVVRLNILLVKIFNSRKNRNIKLQKMEKYLADETNATFLGFCLIIKNLLC